MLQHYLDLARPYLDQYGYWAVFGIVFVESFGIPAPGQAVIIAGAMLAAKGELHIVLLLLIAWSAAVLGDNVGYAIGRYGGRRLVLHRGGLVGLRAHHLERVEVFFTRYGGGIVVAARFFEVLRQLNGVVAGMSGMTWARFVAFNALGAVLWVGLWGIGAYAFAQHMAAIIAVFKRYEPYVIAAGVIALIGLVVYLVRNGRS